MNSYQYPKADVTSSVIVYHFTLHTISILGIIRGKEPFKGETALPGGFLNIGSETLRQCGFREALIEEVKAKGKHGPMSDRPLAHVYDEYGLPRPVAEDLKYVCEQSEPKRDPRVEQTGAPVIDHVYSIEVPWPVFNEPTLTGADDAVGLLRITYDNRDLPTAHVIRQQWAFDHGDSIIQFMHNLGWHPLETNQVVELAKI